MPCWLVARDGSESLFLRFVELRVGNRPALIYVEILDLAEHEGWNISRASRLDVSKVCALDVAQLKNRPQVFLHVSDFNIAHVEALHMPNVETVSRHGAKPVGIRVDVFNLGNLDRRVLPGSAALVKHKDIA
jgi:hypothetical protein